MASNGCSYDVVGQLVPITAWEVVLITKELDRTGKGEVGSRSDSTVTLNHANRKPLSLLVLFWTQ